MCDGGPFHGGVKSLVCRYVVVSCVLNIDVVLWFVVHQGLCRIMFDYTLVTFGGGCL